MLKSILKALFPASGNFTRESKGILEEGRGRLIPDQVTLQVHMSHSIYNYIDTLESRNKTKLKFNTYSIHSHTSQMSIKKRKRPWKCLEYFKY